MLINNNILQQRPRSVNSWAYRQGIPRHKIVPGRLKCVGFSCKGLEFDLMAFGIHTLGAYYLNTVSIVF